jgi:hypothetical protein
MRAAGMTLGVLIAAAAPAQGGPLRAPSTASPGSAISVDVANNADGIDVGLPSGDVVRYEVGGDKSVLVQVPELPPGSRIRIRVRCGGGHVVHEVTVTS